MDRRVDDEPLQPDEEFLGRYRIVGRMGRRRGFAHVYEAQDRFLDRRVAIKVIRGNNELTESSLERGRLEARRWGNLHHPHLVEVLDAGIELEAEEPLLYVVTEYVEGVTLRDLLCERQQLDPLEACELFEAVAEGLEYLHRQDMEHRDLKPENVFLARDGVIKISDFGISKILSMPGWLPSGRCLVGTSLYMSPESLIGLGTTPRSDLYALGMMLWEFLYGEHPFCRDRKPSQQDIITDHLQRVPPRLDQVLSEFPEELARLVATLVAKQAEQRVQSAEQVAAGLRALRPRLERLLATGEAEQGFSMDQPRAREQGATRRPRVLQQVIWFGAGAAAVGVAMGVSELIVGQDEDPDDQQTVNVQSARPTPPLEKSGQSLGTLGSSSAPAPARDVRELQAGAEQSEADPLFQETSLEDEPSHETAQPPPPTEKEPQAVKSSSAPTTNARSRSATTSPREPAPTKPTRTETPSRPPKAKASDQSIFTEAPF